MIGGYYFRAAGYGAVSVGALLAGAFSSPDWFAGKLVILGVPALVSLCFAFGFALTFHHRTFDESQLPAIQTENIIAIPSLLLAAAVAYFLWTGFRDNYGLPAELVPLIAALAVHFVLFAWYSLFLIRTHRRDAGVPARHRLIWPSVLAVAVNYYYGAEIVALRSSMLPLVPIIVLSLFMVVSQWLPRRAFLWASGVLICLSIVGVGMQKFSLIPSSRFLEYLSTLSFAIFLAAYLAVFESWHLTAQLIEAIPPEEQGVRLESGTPVGDHYVATLVALGITIWLMPLFYVFADVSISFLILAALHSCVALLYWTQKVANGSDLAQRKWVRRKNVAGFVFLGILVFDFFFSWFPQFQVPYYVAAFLTALTFPMTLHFLVGNLRSDERWLNTFWDSTGILFLFSRRLNVCRVIASAAWMPMAFLFICQAATHDTSSRFFFKVGPAFVAYLFLVACALTAELVACKPRRTVS